MSAEISNYLKPYSLNLDKILKSENLESHFSDYLSSLESYSKENLNPLNLIVLTKILTDISLLNKETSSVDYDEKFINDLTDYQYDNFYSSIYALHLELTNFLKVHPYKTMIGKRA